MKTRSGFVSNSSSASFVIGLDKITAKQLDRLMNYDNEAEARQGDGWGITKEDDCVRGWTIMDNGDMDEFMEEIGIDRKVVAWEDMG